MGLFGRLIGRRGEAREAGPGLVPDLLAQAGRAVVSGRHADAEALCERIVAIDAGNADALYMTAVIAHQRGDRDRAATLMQRALATAPDSASIAANFALVEMERRRLSEAETLARTAIALQPAADRPHAVLGLVLRHRGDPNGAESALRTAVRLNPRNAEALNNLGNLMRELRRCPESIDFYRQALDARPGMAETLENLGVVLLESAHYGEAECAFRDAVALAPEMPRAHSNLGYALLMLDRIDEAEAASRRALALAPSSPDALVNFAAVRRAQGELDEASRCCRQALAVDAAHVPALLTFGAIQQERGDLKAAEAAFREALRAEPALPGTRYNLGVILLRLGRYGEGFPLFESRFAAFPDASRTTHAATFVGQPERRWTGDPVAGRRLVVWTEQGFGDGLMMLRYFPLLAKQAGDVAVLCHPALERVFRATRGVGRVVTDQARIDEGSYDVHCPIMSLPALFGTIPQSVPGTEDVLAVPPDVDAYWRDRLASVRGLRVGLVWAGSPSLRDNGKRNVSPALFGPVVEVAGATFISLQKGDAALDPRANPVLLREFIEESADFLDTAAILQQLDLVISVDTAVAHLAGVVGCEVWLLNRAHGDWRWEDAGNRSHWYPSMRVFRQGIAMDWTEVATQVVKALRARVDADLQQQPERRR